MNINNPTNISQTDLIWSLSRLHTELTRAPDKTVTVAQVIKERNLAPLASDDPKVRAAILKMIVELAKPELDNGSLKLAALDLDPARRAQFVAQNLGALVVALHARQTEFGRTLGLDSPNLITPGSAAVIADDVERRGISQDQFRGAAEQAFLALCRFGRFDEAIAFAREFSPEAKRGNAQFSVQAIPPNVVEETVNAISQRVFRMLGSDAGFGLFPGVQRLVDIGLIPQALFDREMHRLILSAVQIDGRVPSDLAKFVGSVVTQAEVDAERNKRVDEVISRLVEPSINNMAEHGAAALRALDVPADRIQETLKDGYLKTLERFGLDGADSPWKSSAARSRESFESALDPRRVSDVEKRAALEKYVKTLVRDPWATPQWLSAVAMHKRYFTPQQYEAAILDAAYFALHGYHTDPGVVEQLRAENPTLDWRKLETTKPATWIGSVDLRASLAAKLTDRTERIVADLLCDWLGPSSARRRAHAIEDVFTRLHSAATAATEAKKTGQRPASEPSGLKEESEKEAARAAYVRRAFGGTLKEVPYEALVHVRREAAEIVRAHLSDADEMNTLF